MVNIDLTRRQFIATSAALAVGASLRAEESKVADEGYIDAHSHIWTRDIERYRLAEGQTLEDLTPPSFTSAELLAIAEPANVSRVVLIGHNIYYKYDNSYLIDEAARHPDTFRVVAVIDEKAGDPQPRMQELLTQRVTGFRISPFVSGAGWLQSEGMQAMWRCAVETGQAMCCLLNPEHVPQVDAMCENYPETPVVIDHFARIGADGQIQKQDLENLCRLARHPRVHVKISAYYALGKKAPPYDDLIPMIRQLFDAYGPQRLMWASDSPYQLQPPHTYQASLDLVHQLDFVSDDDRQWLLRNTAKAVYFFV